MSRLRAQRPNLPVIPLPLPPESLDAYALNKFEARQQLGIAADHAVVVWLGRLSLLTKNRSLAYVLSAREGGP